MDSLGFLRVCILKLSLSRCAVHADAVRQIPEDEERSEILPQLHIHCHHLLCLYERHVVSSLCCVCVWPPTVRVVVACALLWSSFTSVWHVFVYLFFIVRALYTASVPLWFVVDLQGRMRRFI